MNTNENANDFNMEERYTGMEVAVIGMSCRFPKSNNIDEFWDNLVNARECVTFFTDEELEKAGINPELIKNPNYVKANAILDKMEYFDAAFFGYSPSEALIMHPQLRFFHECSWLALEDAGIVPSSYDGLIGVYAGGRPDGIWELSAMFGPSDNSLNVFTKSVLCTKDQLAMRISYTLDLRGPSYTFYTACSTSLVAVHLACQAVLSGECDVALAGGVTIMLPQIKGYIYNEEMIYSKDGHTRSFDAEAKGLVAANGIGVVVVKPLEDAIRDKDHIYAVVRGTGINNDGNRKVGYTASSIKGQEALMKEVYRTSEVEMDSILFVECHGSATPLGDPVEIEALRRSFYKTKGNLCGIGSVKSNIGHCDCGAGIASFIKTVLAVYHRVIPPNINFKTPNPKIDFENSPFYVVTHLTEMKNDKYPVRASVNSLGLGGTNVHVILEEAPPIDVIEVSEPRREYFILPLSAKNPRSLEMAIKNLLEFFKKNPDTSLADVAYTLQKRRASFPYRQAFVCSNVEEAIKLLSDPQTAPIQPFLAGERERPIVFMFSGQGSEYINMGLDLYRTEPSFREDIDYGFKYLTSLIGEDIKYVLYPSNEKEMEESEKRIHRFYYTQPVKFIYEYAHSRLLMKWGISPYAMIGYSFGEYIESCLSGVFTMEDALKVLMTRGIVMEKAPAGNMMTVSLSESQLIPLLKPGIYIGGINTDELCLVSGTAEAIDAFEKELNDANVGTVRYRAACGGHSPVMDPILPELGEALVQIKYNKPRIPFVSGLTGTWMTVEDALDPFYFTRQLREPVRFADALRTLFEKSDAIFLEVGPGTTLANFAKYYKDAGLQSDILVNTMVRHHKDPVPDHYFLLNRIALLWTYGRKIDWNAFYGDEERRVVSLPGYAFDSQYYWNDFDIVKMAMQLFQEKNAEKKPHVEDWFYLPSWKSSILPVLTTKDEIPLKPWLVFLEPQTFAERFVQYIQNTGRPVISVYPGSTFTKTNFDRFQIDMCDSTHYSMLFNELKTLGTIPSSIIHAWTLNTLDSSQDIYQWNDQIQDAGFHSLLYIAQAIGRETIESPIQMEVLLNGSVSVAGEFLEYPFKATAFGPVKNIPQEYPNIKCRAVDIVIPEEKGRVETSLFALLEREFLEPQTREQIIAYRNRQRFILDYETIKLSAPSSSLPCFRQNGVYLLTGGLGGVALSISKYLHTTFNARLVLTTRTGLMPREQWKDYLEKTTDKRDKEAGRIRHILELENNGAEFMIELVDVSDEEAMRKTVEKVEARFGRIHGVIHTAYVHDGTIIERRTKETTENVWKPKIKGALILDRIFSEREPLDFVVLCSSLAGIFGPVAQVGYTGASAFMDAFSKYCSQRNDSPTRYVTIDWCAWAEIGALIDSIRTLAGKIGFDEEAHYRAAMKPAEGVDAFVRAMSIPASQVLVSTQELSILIEHLNTNRTSGGFQEALAAHTETPKNILKRPQLKTVYIAPRTKTEEQIAKVWQDLFGLETVGMRDDFFELGGDSLKAMTVSSRIHKELSVKIPIAMFFSSPTIEDMARYIAEKDGIDMHISIPQTPQSEYYPCSYAQARYYLQQIHHPGEIALNIVTPVLIPISLDMDKLEAALSQIIHRHDIYRSSFHLIDGRVVMKVHDSIDFKVQYHDVAEEDVNRLADELIQPFELDKAPILRVHVLRLAPETIVVMIDTHYMIMDGVSSRLFMREMVELYFGKELPPVSIGFKDYCSWMADRVEEGKLDSSRVYWMEQLKAPLPQLQLPLDFPRPLTRDFEANSTGFNIERDLLLQLRKLMKETGTTMFMVWLAAYNLLLSEYSGQEEIVMAIRTANRPYNEMLGLMGKIANDHIFRSFPRKEKSFRKYLEEVKETSVMTFKHQEYPYEKVLEALEIDEKNGQQPFCSTMFVFNNNNMEVSNVRAEGLQLAFYHLEGEKCLYDIHFQAIEMEDYIHFRLMYSTALFKPETIEKMKNRLAEILETITRNPDEAISQII